MIHRVVLLAALTFVPRAEAQPATPLPVAASEAPSEDASSPDPGPDPTGAADPTYPTDPDDPNRTVLQIVEQPADPDPVEHRMETQRFAVPPPPPPRRHRDPALRKARGMLAGGIILTAICGVGSALAIFAGVQRGKHLSGTSGDNIVRAAAVLVVCTAGSIAFAAQGVTRVKKLRHLAEWTGGLGLRF